MQILYAAPFLIFAAASFFICVSIPKLRAHALVIPVGCLSFGVGALIAYLIFAVIVERLGYKGPANWFYLIPYVLGGFVTAVVSATLYRIIVAILPLWIIRAGLLIGTFCSAIVLGSLINIAAVSFLGSVRIVWIWCLVALLAVLGAAVIMSHAELFRPQPCLPWLQRRIFQTFYFPVI